ncbi:MAG: hypothetical protein QOG55_3479 [Acidobacteriaceae bacterium]|nr:hypothetical protein [Acidobacteriaceae bacterium]
MATSPAHCFSIFSVLILASSVALPNLVVPNFPDLAIKTRHTSGDQKSADQFSEARALYLKGSRQRTETTTEKPLRGDEINSASIWQCDEKRSFFLNQREKIYYSSVIENRSEQLKKTPPVSVPQMSGAQVTITIDSVDTGERRQFGHYTARHVRIKTAFEPGPGASMPASVEETDGWYIDLPGFRCEEQPYPGFAFVSVSISGTPRDRLQVKWLGKAPRGYPIEETSVKTSSTDTTVSKIKLLEISEGPLSPSLFELPQGYRHALQTGYGGADLTKPDTMFNRANYYWIMLRLWLRSLFT